MNKTVEKFKSASAALLLVVVGVCGGYVYAMSFGSSEITAEHQRIKTLVETTPGIMDDSGSIQKRLLEDILAETKVLQQEIRKYTSQLNKQLTTLSQTNNSLNSSALASNSSFGEGLTTPSEEELQALILDFQAGKQRDNSVEFLERREKEYNEAIEWTDNLDPNSPLSDG